LYVPVDRKWLAARAQIKATQTRTAPPAEIAASAPTPALEPAKVEVGGN
jgi:hypothetical protein